MPFSSGTITATRYRASDPCPPDAAKKFTPEMNRQGWRPIQADKGEMQSFGWVDPRNPLSTRLDWDRQTLGAYLFLMVRIDRKSLPAALLKAHVREALRALAKEKKGRQIPRAERRALEEKVAADLLRQVSPSVAFYEAVWNTATGDVYFAAASRFANDVFNDLFVSTFSLDLLAACPMAVAGETAESLGMEAGGLAHLKPAFWGAAHHGIPGRKATGGKSRKEA